ncbi:MAG: protein YgfX [Pseudomonadota bacterium]
MLEKIRAYSRKQNKLLLNSSTAPRLANNVDLAAVTVYPSRYLWQAQWVVYGAMLVFAFVALAPLFFTSIYWVALWLLLGLWISVVIHKVWRAKRVAPMQLQIKQNHWYLKTKASEFLVMPSPEILLWTWVIIIPLYEPLTRNQHYLIALPDSLPKEDWRRLQMWLRTCF